MPSFPFWFGFLVMKNSSHKLRQTITAYVKSLRSPGTRKSSPLRKRILAYEPLEARIALSATGLVDIGTQPDGNLSDKIFYINGGHGYADNSGTGSWTYGRGLTYGIVEDLGNQDQMTFFADYLFRAGATVVPMRPIGNQPNEVIMDNDDPGVTFIGAWTNSTSGTFFGSAGDVPYRYAATSATETAIAKYTPNIPVAGFYPVYTWVHSGSDRTEQVYRINHSGGSTEVTVNHRRVGDGMVYLGTYYFEAGTSGSVEISNRSSEAGKVVIADMLRFGNGMGDTNRGGGVSGRPREDELSLYWIEWQVNHTQGISFDPTISTLDTDSNVNVVPRYAAFMNRETEGSLADRVLISFHTNAAGGRGVLGLYNGNNRASAKTPNQFELASLLGQEINDDLVAQAGLYEYNWFDAGNNVTLDRSDIEFGEINNERINNEFDATIVEVAYHDDSRDAALLRDPKVRNATAKATYQGVVKYFNSLDSVTSLTMLPGKVTAAQAKVIDADSVQISWTPPLANSYNGDAPTGYLIYGSTNGYGFDGGTFVAGGTTTTFTMNGLNSAEGPYYFKVVAVNSGGEGEASEVVAAILTENPSRILIVNGFDRLSRQQNPTQTVSGGQAERVRPRSSNSYDYVTQVASAINAFTHSVGVDTTSNDALISGAVDLNDYDAVIWISGEESTADDTFNNLEQSLVTNYLSAGGKLFASGSEIGWDLDAQNNGRAFYNNQLRADYVSDDAGTYNVSGLAGSIFDGLSFSFDNGSKFYDVDYPDVIAPFGGSTAALSYSTNTTAGIVYDGGIGGSKVVVFGFPVETITDDSLRNQVFARVLDFFDFEPEYDDVDEILDNDKGPGVYTETGSWTTSSSPGFEGGTYRFVAAGTVAKATWTFDTPFAGQGEVFVQYYAAVNRTTSTVYHIDTGTGIETVSIDQRQNNFTWVSLGIFNFTAGTHSITLDAEVSTGGSVVVADVVRVVIPAPATEPSADFDGDGNVDGHDFLLWQRGFGLSQATSDQGDANDDGNVDGVDLAVWQNQYGLPVQTRGLAAVDAIETVLSSDENPAFLIAPIINDSSTAMPRRFSSGQSLQALAHVMTTPPQILLTDDLPGIRRNSESEGDIATSREAPQHDSDFASDFDTVFTNLGNNR
jgi:hypothetical protein